MGITYLQDHFTSSTQYHHRKISIVLKAWVCGLSFTLKILHLYAFMKIERVNILVQHLPRIVCVHL